MSLEAPSASWLRWLTHSLVPLMTFWLSRHGHSSPLQFTRLCAVKLANHARYSPVRIRHTPPGIVTFTGESPGLLSDPGCTGGGYRFCIKQHDCCKNTLSLPLRDVLITNDTYRYSKSQYLKLTWANLNRLKNNCSYTEWKRDSKPNYIGHCCQVFTKWRFKYQTT